MKMIAGAFLRASWNRSRTRAAPTPTIISTNSDPLIEKNGTSASPATARASSVLPVPGAPTRSTPFGAVPPRRVYFSGFLRKSTISTSSFSASSIPATSVEGDLCLRLLVEAPCPALSDAAESAQHSAALFGGPAEHPDVEPYDQERGAERGQDCQRADWTPSVSVWL